MLESERYFATDDLREDRRFIRWASCVGLIAAYVILVPLRWYGMTPDLDWWALICAPIGLFGLLASFGVPFGSISRMAVDHMINDRLVPRALCTWLRRKVYQEGRVVSRWIARGVRRDILVISAARIDDGVLIGSVRTLIMSNSAKSVPLQSTFGPPSMLQIAKMWMIPEVGARHSIGGNTLEAAAAPCEPEAARDISIEWERHLLEIALDANDRLWDSKASASEIQELYAAIAQILRHSRHRVPFEEAVGELCALKQSEMSVSEQQSYACGTTDALRQYVADERGGRREDA